MACSIQLRFPSWSRHRSPWFCYSCCQCPHLGVSDCCEISFFSSVHEDVCGIGPVVSPTVPSSEVFFQYGYHGGWWCRPKDPDCSYFAGVSVYPLGRGYAQCVQHRVSIQTGPSRVPGGIFVVAEFYREKKRRNAVADLVAPSLRSHRLPPRCSIQRGICAATRERRHL